MNDIISKSAKVFFLSIIVSVACIFVVISFNTIEVALFTEDIYYDVYHYADENDDGEFLYRHYFKNGEDKKIEEYKDIPEEEIRKFTQRSNPKPIERITISVISQISCFIILISFMYNELWKIGNKDFEAERLHNQKISKLKGLYIGLFAVVPSVLFLSFCLIAKNTNIGNLPIAMFTFSHSYAWEIIFTATNGITKWADVQWWQALVYYAVLLIVPAICVISYNIGFKDISIEEKLVYKNGKKIRRG